MKKIESIITVTTNTTTVKTHSKLPELPKKFHNNLLVKRKNNPGQSNKS